MNGTSLLSLRKTTPVVGTYEPNAFILSMRNDRDLDSLHSYGIHSIPHIGVYGSNYSIALPMVLLSITPSIEFLRQLPPDSLNALDINLQHIYETSLKDTAIQIVDRALQSAKKRLHLLSLKWRDQNRRAKVQYWTDNEESFVSEIESNGSFQERFYAQEGVEEDLQLEYSREIVSFENTMTGTAWRQDGVIFGENWVDNEEEIRKIARKLVHKVLHLAHTRWDETEHKSSIDYLIASTKRLKISVSPSYSPPPPVSTPPDPDSPSKQNESEDPKLSPFNADSGINLSASTSALFSFGSSCSENDFVEEARNLGKRRQRSDSHDLTMQRDLDKIRFKLQGRKYFSEPLISLKQTSDLHIHVDSVETEELPLGPPDLDFNRLNISHERRSVSEILYDMRKLSIMEVQEEEEEDTEEDEEYTLLEAITKPLQTIADELEPAADKLETEAKPFKRRLNHVLPEFSTVEEHCGLDPIPNNPHSHSDYTFNDPLFFEPLVHPDSHNIPNLDYYIIIHTHPLPGLCQKFLCNNTNEINLIYHCWLYKELPFDPTITVSQQVEMGVFDPIGVCPVHLDLMDSGISFFYVEPRTVCIHDCCFSPENAQLQLTSSNQSFRSFLSIASCDNRKVITFHLIPCDKHIESDLSATLNQCGDTLLDLIEIINPRFPDLEMKFQHLLKPLFMQSIQ